MFPLLGILFLIALGGIFVGIVSLFFKKSRVFAAYLLLCPVCAAFLSFWLFWGGGFLVEYIFGPTRWSTLGAFLGYTGGFAVGALAGFFVARRINRRLFA
jgi:hypothetical protein